MTSANTAETLIRWSDGTLEEDGKQAPKRVALVEADFLVRADGTVKLIDPPGKRLTRSLLNGHPVVSFGGYTYWVADLVARAFLNSKYGHIEFLDNDRENVSAANLVIDMTEVTFDRYRALMWPDFLPFRQRRIPPRGMSMSRQQRMFLC